MSKNDTKARSILIELDYPVISDGTELRVLHMRRPKVKDQIFSDKQGGSEGEKEIRLVANLCEISPDVIGDLDVSDYKKISKELRLFFGMA